MTVLQGFEEVNITAPTAKITMTVMKSRIRFNKATATALGYPAYVKVLVNGKTKQIALQACDGRDANAVKFSKPEGKQKSALSVADQSILDAASGFFSLKAAPQGEESYQSVTGKFYPEEKTAVFDASDAVAGIMKRRGRKIASAK